MNRKNLLLMMLILMVLFFSTANSHAAIDVEMILNNGGFESYSHFKAELFLNNHDEEIPGAEIFGILEIDGVYYFWPDFGTEVNYQTVTIATGVSYVLFLEFDFPDIDDIMPYGPLRIWGAWYMDADRYGYDVSEFWLDREHKWTPTPVATDTPQPTFTPVPSTSPPTSTPTPPPTFTSTATSTSTSTPVPTFTPTATYTFTPTPTFTPVPPTQTFTPTVTPTATFTSTFTPTMTPTATFTSVPPTNTFTPTSTLTSTPTVTPSAIDTPEPTNTPTNTSTQTPPTETPTETPTPTWTPETTPSVTPTAPEGFVYIPAGTFQMGSPSDEMCRDSNEGPVHSVTLTHGFYIQSTEVTQQQWMDVFGSNPSDYTGMNRPVEKVTWYDCCIYCNRLSQAERLTPCYYSDASYTTVFDGTPPFTIGPVYWNESANGYRLPTEAEWEYACRAGTSTAYNSGLDNRSCGSDPNLDPLGRYWYNGGSPSQHANIGSYQANNWGLYDMHGNLWEWCWDWYSSGYYSSSPSTDPTGPSFGTGRVARGGSWRDHAENCRSANRYNFYSVHRSDRLGFRIMRTTY